MAAPATVSDKVKTTYQELKVSKKYRYITCMISNQEIVMDSTGDRNATYDSFLKDLQKGGTSECRYGVIDFEYTSKGSLKSKIILILWSPKTAKISLKMLYVSALEGLRSALVGVAMNITAENITEISKENVEKKIGA